MAVIRKTLSLLAVLAAFVVAIAICFAYWSRQPIMAAGEQPLEVSVAAGSSLRGALRQLHDGGVPASPLLMEVLARGLGTPHVKPGSYRIDARMVAPGYAHPEGLFYPDTYVYERGTSDLVLLQQAHQRMLKMLNDAWGRRASGLPYETPYDALVMASIVEKETGCAWGCRCRPTRR